MTEPTRGAPALALLLSAALLVTVPQGTRAQSPCPGEPGSEFCEFYELFAAQERSRKQIVAAAREAGMEDPGGAITVRRDSSGTLTMEKWELELPESVETRLNGYLTPLVMNHLTEPGSSVTVNLDLTEPVPLPHPDSADRQAEQINEDEINKLIGRLVDDPSTSLPDDTTTITLQVFLDAAGNVRQITVEQSTGVESLDAKIVRIYEETEFRPALRKGAPTAGWVEQRYSLTPPR